MPNQMKLYINIALDGVVLCIYFYYNVMIHYLSKLPQHMNI